MFTSPKSSRACAMELLEERKLFVAYMWVAPAGGAWGAPGNWAPFGVPGPADTATIALPGTYTVALGAPTTVLALTIGSGGAGGTQTLAAAANLDVVGMSTIGVDGVLQMTPTFIVSNVFRTGTLAMPGGVGTVDLTDNDMIVGPGTPKAMIEGLIRQALNGGAWNFPGITSATARTNPQRSTSLGVLSGAQYMSVGGGLMFDGFALLPGSTAVKYTWCGDVDFNGVVDFDDYVRHDNGFNNNLGGWVNGDVDFNGSNDFDDYVLLDASFNVQNGIL